MDSGEEYCMRGFWKGGDGVYERILADVERQYKENRLYVGEVPEWVVSSTMGKVEIKTKNDKDGNI
jgi:hypothetical protein